MGKYCKYATLTALLLLSSAFFISDLPAASNVRGEGESEYEFVSPVEDEFIEGEYTFKLIAWDDDGIDKVELLIGMEVFSTVFVNETGYYQRYINTLTLYDGEYESKWRIFDSLGNLTETSNLSFKVDNTPPEMVINSPQDGEVISWLFFFDVENDDEFKKTTEYNIDGSSWTKVSIGWNTWEFADGPHNVTLRAIDQAGHTTTASLTIIVDNNPPELSILNPVEGEFIEGTYTIKVMATDEVGLKSVTMKIGTMTKPMSYNTPYGYYEYQMDTGTLSDGSYTIDATAVDAASREVTTSLQFKVDNNLPELTVESPVKDQLVSGLLGVKAKTTDQFPGVVKYSVDGTTWYDVATLWNSMASIDGEHTISVMTQDQAGHTTRVNITVIVDNNSPVIAQTSLTPGQILSGTQRLSFYVNDSVGIEKVLFTIDHVAPFEIFQSNDGLNYEYILDTRILSDGDHHVTVTVYDRAGNYDGSTYGIKVDNSGPDITLDHFWLEDDMEVRFGEVKEGNPVFFHATVTDPSGIGPVIISIDSSGWTNMTPDPQGPDQDDYIFTWDTTGVFGGTHTFQVKVSDLPGNEKVISGKMNVSVNENGGSRDEQPVSIFLIVTIVVIIALLMGINLAVSRMTRRTAVEEPVLSTEIIDGMETIRPQKGEQLAKAGYILGIIASVVLGIWIIISGVLIHMTNSDQDLDTVFLSLCFFFPFWVIAFFLSPQVSIAGIILGILALVKGPGKNKARAIFGLVICILLIPLLLITYGLLNLIVTGHI